MGKINKETLSWLTTVPASDINFQTRLKSANWETCHEAILDKNISKTARKLIVNRMKKMKL